MHAILDNYGADSHADVKAWLAKHSRFHLHSPRLRARG